MNTAPTSKTGSGMPNHLFWNRLKKASVLGGLSRRSRRRRDRAPPTACPGVVISEWTRSRTVMNPLISPINPPHTIAPTAATGPGSPATTIRCPMMPDSAITDPTDRSIAPEIRPERDPTDTMPSTDDARAALSRLVAVRNSGITTVSTMPQPTRTPVARTCGSRRPPRARACGRGLPAGARAPAVIDTRHSVAGRWPRRSPAAFLRPPGPTRASPRTERTRYTAWPEHYRD